MQVTTPSLTSRMYRIAGYTCALVATGLLALPCYHMNYLAEHLRWWQRATLATLFIVIARFGLLFQDRSHKHDTVYPINNLGELPKTFILYLRPFRSDTQADTVQIANQFIPTQTEGTMIVRTFSHIAPVVAVIDPIDKRPIRGAAMISATASNWRDRVGALAEMAMLIVLHYAPTPGCITELSILTEHKLLHKVVNYHPRMSLAIFDTLQIQYQRGGLCLQQANWLFEFLAINEARYDNYFRFSVFLSPSTDEQNAFRSGIVPFYTGRAERWTYRLENSGISGPEDGLQLLYTSLGARVPSKFRRIARESLPSLLVALFGIALCEVLWWYTISN